MKEEDLRDHIELVTKTFLDWGLTPSMRGITIGWNDKERILNFRAYTDNQASIETDTDKLADLGVYVWSQFSNHFGQQWAECIYTTAPLSELENLGIWIYSRNSEF